MEDEAGVLVRLVLTKIVLLVSVLNNADLEKDLEIEAWAQNEGCESRTSLHRVNSSHAQDPGQRRWVFDER